MLVYRGRGIIRGLSALIAVGPTFCAGGARGDITFAAPVAHAVTTPGNAVAVDLDKDGKLDIIGSSGNNLFILYGNGDGTFAAAVYLSVGANTYEVTPADVDKDGRIDLVACAS